MTGTLYEFVFRGILAEEALDKAGRLRKALPQEFDPEIARRLGLDLLDDSLVDEARRMSIVYVVIAAFENSVRRLVSGVLLENIGEDWWDQAVSERIRKRAEGRRLEEEKVKWHTQRGTSLVYFTELGDIGSVMRNNWQYFEPFIPSIDWATSVFTVVERSRNVIMHSGSLGARDVERVGIHIRDWIKQVGA